MRIFATLCWLWWICEGEENFNLREILLSLGRILFLGFEYPSMLDGMFGGEKNKHISAALLFFMDKTVILENPNADIPLLKEVLLSLTCLSNFDLNLSQVRIPNGYYTKEKFSAKIEQQRNMINSITSEDLQV